MKRLNKCTARYDSNTLISYSTLIYKRTGNYTFIYRYHSATTANHWYKFCAKIDIDYPVAHAMWNEKSRTHAIMAISNDGTERTRYYYNGEALWKDRDAFKYPEEVPHMGYNVIDRY